MTAELATSIVADTLIAYATDGTQSEQAITESMATPMSDDSDDTTPAETQPAEIAQTEPPPVGDEEPRDVEMRRLPCDLGEEEIATLRAQSADIAVTICDRDEQLKRFTEETKAFLKSQAANRRALTEKIESRNETRNIECVWTKNFGNGRKELLRVDTGAVVDWKPLSAEDRQQKLTPQFRETVTADDSDETDSAREPTTDSAPDVASEDMPFDAAPEYVPTEPSEEQEAAEVERAAKAVKAKRSKAKAKR